MVDLVGTANCSTQGTTEEYLSDEDTEHGEFEIRRLSVFNVYRMINIARFHSFQKFIVSTFVFNHAVSRAEETPRGRMVQATYVFGHQAVMLSNVHCISGE